MAPKLTAPDLPTTLLLVAHSFPPENVSGAARPYRFFRYLPEAGIRPIVVTAVPQDEEREDIVAVRDLARDSQRGSWSWQLERVIRKTILPGEVGLTWSRKAAAACAALVPAGGRAAVMSTSPPFSAHLAALGARRRTGIPWIADFRDPMYLRIPGRFGIYPRIESYLLRHADAVIANTDGAAERLARRYPGSRDKLNVIWNGFDPADEVRAAAIPPRGHRRLVHVGEIYVGRHPGPILQSARRLLAGGAIAPGKLRISLVGPVNERELPDPGSLHEMVAEGLVECRPERVPQEVARKIACEADGLLLLQPQSDIQVPAKLFEYIRIGRPILAFVRRDSPSERILALSGVRYRAIYPDDPPGEVDAKLLEFLAMPTDPLTPSRAFDEQFDARSHARSLAAIVDDLLARPCATLP